MVKIKQWRNNGEQDKYIVKLIKQGKIHKDTKPASLKTSYPAIFGDFSLNVIRNHLNVLKRNTGIYLEDENENFEDVLDNKQEEIDEGQHDVSNDPRVDLKVTPIFGHENYPILLNTFKDPETQVEKVVMGICLPGGVGKVKLDVSEDGMTAIIKYNWPETMFHMDDLFKKQISSKEMNIHHPMISSIQNSLENVRMHIDEAPEATVVVTLPIKVQTAPGSWVKFGVKRETGTQVVISTFTGYIKNYTKKSLDSTVTFDM